MTELCRLEKLEIRDLAEHGAKPWELALVYQVEEWEIWRVLSKGRGLSSEHQPEWPGAPYLPWSRDPHAWALVEREGPMLLERVGQALGICRERVRQIEESALYKLSNQGIAIEAFAQLDTPATREPMTVREPTRYAVRNRPWRPRKEEAA